MMGERILVVEDDEDMRTVLEEILKEEDYRAILAQSGEEALKIIRDQLPDLIILDLKIPKPNGFEVTTLLKDNFRTAHIPVMDDFRNWCLAPEASASFQGIQLYDKQLVV